MVDYTIVATFEYDNFAGFWVESPEGLTVLPAPLVYSDIDTTFNLGEDLTGGGNQYIGYIEIEGVNYPVVTSVGGDTSNTLVLVPQGTDPNTINFPTPVDTNNTNTSPFVEASSSHCFAHGTLISTPKGQVPVEDLKQGDLVLTSDGRAVPVFWLGRQKIEVIFAGRGFSMVEIAQGALGDGMPSRPLRITGDHALLIDGMLVNASALVNHDTIRYVPFAELGEVVTTYHVETEKHEAIVAEGAAAESFIDYVGRNGFVNYSEYLATYGADRIISEMGVPRISASRLVPDSIRLRIALTSSSAPKVSAA